MDEQVPDHIRASFSEFTGKLEDMSELAVTGQSPTFTTATARDVCSDLRAALIELLKKTAEIDNDLRDNGT